jgi:hypothetical protein
LSSFISGREKTQRLVVVACSQAGLPAGFDVLDVIARATREHAIELFHSDVFCYEDTGANHRVLISKAAVKRG